MLESFLIKLQAFRSATFFKKKTSTQVFACEDFEIFKNTYFEEYLRMADIDFVGKQLKVAGATGLNMST